MSSLTGAPPPRGRRLFAALRVLAWVYLAAVATFVALLLQGERFWLSLIALYLPRFALLGPLLVLSPLAFARKERRRFALQALAATAVIVAVAGPHVSLAARPTGGPRVRVLSYNVWYGRQGMAAIEREVDRGHADVVLFQAVSPAVVAHFTARFGEAIHTHATGEFLIASAFPIVDVGPRSSRGFLRYTIDSPLGLLDVYAVHPLSPRPGLNEVRHQSKRRLLTEGPSSEAVLEVEANAEVREREIAELAEAAASSKNPVILGGDYNLPELSAIFRRHLARYQDGFAKVGNGFGYTFPANVGVPWMRIDRILAGPELRFMAFSVGGRGGSDHCPVWADLERR